MDEVRVLSNPDVVTVGKQGEKSVVVSREQISVITRNEQGPVRDVVNRIPVAVSDFTVEETMLIPGINIVAVNYNGNVTIHIPSSLDTRKLLYVKDESDTAATNNITIQAT